MLFWYFLGMQMVVVGMILFDDNLLAYKDWSILFLGFNSRFVMNELSNFDLAFWVLFWGLRRWPGGGGLVGVVPRNGEVVVGEDE